MLRALWLPLHDDCSAARAQLGFLHGIHDEVSLHWLSQQHSLSSGHQGLLLGQPLLVTVCLNFSQAKLCVKADTGGHMCVQAPTIPRV